MGFWGASPLDREEPGTRKSLPGRPNTHGEGKDRPDQLKESEGLAVALYVAVKCPEKRGFDTVWAKLNLLLSPYAPMTIGSRHTSLRPLGPNPLTLTF